MELEQPAALGPEGMRWGLDAGTFSTMHGLETREQLGLLLLQQEILEVKNSTDHSLHRTDFLGQKARITQVESD